MKIFISWSGDTSKYIAETFSNWLEQVLQAVEPWISSSDIEKGKRWNDEISKRLRDSKIGIICLTTDNLESNWIHFEAGAIAKTEDAHVCTFLYDISPVDVKQPLSQFQNTQNNKKDILELLRTINAKIEESGGKKMKDSSLEDLFETLYPKLEEKLNNVPAVKSDKKSTHRSDREILEEMLQLLRGSKNRDNSISISESDKDEIIDYWIDIYATTNNIPKNSFDFDLKVNQFISFLKQIPEIELIFGTVPNLKSKVNQRISELPF